MVCNFKYLRKHMNHVVRVAFGNARLRFLHCIKEPGFNANQFILRNLIECCFKSHIRVHSIVSLKKYFSGPFLSVDYFVCATTKPIMTLPCHTCGSVVVF